MSQTSALSITRNRVTIDGTDSNGNPWIAGDANAAAVSSQSPFPRAVDLNNVTQFSVSSNDNTIKGLHIKNTHNSGTNQAKDLLVFSGLRNVIHAVRVDGGNSCTSGQCSCSGSTCYSLVTATSGTSTNPAVTVKNVEGLAALDQAVDVTDGGYVVTHDGWFHHNLRGGLRVSGKAGLNSVRNMVEQSGRAVFGTQRTPTPGASTFSADGLGSIGETGGSPTTLTTNANVIRLSGNNGISVKDNGVPVLAAANDYICGSAANGIGLNQPVTVSGTGVGAVYNNSRGVFVPSTVTSGSVTFGSGHNAFARNAGDCDFRSDSSLSISATSNQWGPNASGTPGPHKCGSGAGSVNTSTVQNFAQVSVSLDANPTTPSNVFVAGQSVRVAGTGFNAVDGNPAPSGCSAGNPTQPGDSCCLTSPGATNTCQSGVHNPRTDGSQCVEFLDASGNWQKMPVTSVTPTRILVGIPSGGNGIACSGGLGEKVWVSKWDYIAGVKKEDDEVWCNTSKPMDQL